MTLLCESHYNMAEKEQGGIAMKLSMWILYDWLQKYHPVARIEVGEAVLRSARILSTDTRLERQNVYLAPASEFISDAGNKVICVHDHDLLILDTPDMDSVLNDIFDAFDYYNGWSDGLAEEIRDGCELQHILDASYPVFHQPMVIYDTGHIVMAYTKEYGVGSLDQEWDTLVTTGSNSFEMLHALRNHLKNSRSHRQVEEVDLPQFQCTSLQRLVFLEDTMVCRLILREVRKATKGEWQLLEQLGQLTGYWMKESYKTKRLREESAIFCELLEGKPVSPKELLHRMQLREWEPEHEKTLFTIPIGLSNQDMTFPLITRLERLLYGSYVFSYQGNVYVLANTTLTPEETLCGQLQPILKQSDSCCIVSTPFRETELLADFAAQCNLTIQYAPKKGGELYHCRDYALPYICHMLQTHVHSSMVHPALQILRENDERSHNHLYTTLYCYLRNKCSLVLTAEELHLHRNSLLYRMQKIEALVHIDLEDPDTREYLLLSYLAEDKGKET